MANEQQSRSERAAFEAWISAPPYERNVSRFKETDPSWPGSYRDLDIDLAWQAWKAAVSERGLWQPIATAPKDGQAILLLSKAFTQDFGPDNGGLHHHAPKCAIGSWNAEGDSWVDEGGQGGGECFTLAVTGIWNSGGGWFEPHEVTHWMPLPQSNERSD